MLQSALDPHYCNFSDGGYHLSATSYQKLAYTLWKQLELIVRRVYPYLAFR
jgi:hypothetical protein